jgi:hypothetical protein
MVMFTAALVALACGFVFVAQPASATVTTSANLIRNGNAEKDTCGTNTVVAPTSWTTVQGTPTDVCWTTGGGFPISTDPGPTRRGTGFFAGGPDSAKSVLRESRSLAPYASAIAAGHATFMLSGYFGGFASQNDNAKLTVTFFDASRHVIGTPTVIGGVTAADRGSKTGLLQRALAASVPTNAASVRFAVTFTRTEGSYNDGYADSLSFQMVTAT